MALIDFFSVKKENNKDTHTGFLCKKMFCVFFLHESCDVFGMEVNMF